MQATALLAVSGALDDQFGNGGNVAQFDEIRERRKEWICPSALTDLVHDVKQRERLGLGGWMLWSLVGCDLCLPRNVRQMQHPAALGCGKPGER